MTMLLDAFVSCETCKIDREKQTEVEDLRVYPGVNSPLYPKMLQDVINKYASRVCELHNIRNH